MNPAPMPASMTPEQQRRAATLRAYLQANELEHTETAVGGFSFALPGVRKLQTPVRLDVGVHALGVLTGPAVEDPGGPVVGVRWTRLAEPVLRADLLADPAAQDAEVLRMPAGSNPSWLSARQYAAVLAHGPGGSGGCTHSCGWDDGSP